MNGNARMKKFRVVAAVAALVLVGSVAVTTQVQASGNGIRFGGGDSDHGGSDAVLACPGGMVRLGQVLDQDVPVFPGDPPPVITQVATVDPDGFLLEVITTGTHTGTHLSAPGHFIEGAATIDDLTGADFAWPAYVIDVRERVAQNPRFQLSVGDLKTYERRVGAIPSGALVILYTGFQDLWLYPVLYNGEAPGFAPAAIDWLFKQRAIKGVGTDTYGPDATSDVDFKASAAVYSHGGITIENMAGLNQLNRTGDIVMAGTVALRDGSGYQTDPLGCLGS